MALERIAPVLQRIPAGMSIRIETNNQAKLSGDAVEYLAATRADWYIDRETGQVALVPSEETGYTLVQSKRARTRAIRCTPIARQWPAAVGTRFPLQPCPTIHPRALIATIGEPRREDRAALSNRRAAGREHIRNAVRSAEGAITMSPKHMDALATRYALTPAEVRRAVDFARDEYLADMRNQRLNR